MNNNQRPGVYSSYSVASGYATPRSKKAAAIVHTENLGDIPKVQRYISYTDAKSTIVSKLSDTTLLNAIKILFESGVSSVVLSAVSGSNYNAAVTALSSYKDIGIVVADCDTTAKLLEVQSGIIENSQNQNEQICIFGFSDKPTAISGAQALNNERSVVVSPALTYGGETHQIFGACALAGAVLSKNDPTYNFNGFLFEGFETENNFTESDIQELISKGISVFEQIGSQVECIRAVSTKTLEGDTPDLSMRSINTILIIDDVMSTIRQSLSGRLKGYHISTSSLDSIASQVIVELNAKKNDGLLESFESPLVYSHDSDPSICVVELSFNIAHVISQIHITAHIEL